MAAQYGDCDDRIQLRRLSLTGAAPLTVGSVSGAARVFELETNAGDSSRGDHPALRT